LFGEFQEQPRNSAAVEFQNSVFQTKKFGKTPDLEGSFWTQYERRLNRVFSSLIGFTQADRAWSCLHKKNSHAEDAEVAEEWVQTSRTSLFIAGWAWIWERPMERTSASSARAAGAPRDSSFF
jgi:hypothetical protein